MLLDRAPLWFAATNTWVVAPEPGGPAVLVDAPPDAPGVVDLLGRHRLVATALLLTHGHVDHMGGARPLQERSPLAVHVHPDDDFLTMDPLAQVRMLFGMIPPGDYRPPLERVDLTDGERLSLAGVDFQVRHTPGHTPGHCCFLVEREGWLFSGDQLFAGSIGRTDLPGGSHTQLMESMRQKVLVLDDDTRVLPGHGPETTVGHERRTNPFLAGLE